MDGFFYPQKVLFSSHYFQVSLKGKSMGPTVLALNCYKNVVAAVQVSQSQPKYVDEKPQVPRSVQCVALLGCQLLSQRTGVALATSLKPLQGLLQPGVQVVSQSELEKPF